MWTIKRIDEADYGCEERLPGEPLVVLITIENEVGQIARFECPENWITSQGLDEGDEWTEDIDAIDGEIDSMKHMSEWHTMGTVLL